MEDFLKEQALFSWSGTRSTGVTFRWQVIYIMFLESLAKWVGKEFPDMRQNERKIKIIRGGDTVRTVGQLKGELTLNRGP